MKHTKPVGAQRIHQPNDTWTWARKKRGAHYKKPFQWGEMFKALGRHLRFAIVVLTVIVVCTSPIWGWMYLSVNNLFPVKNVMFHTINGTEHYVSGDHKQRIINELMGQNLVSYDLTQQRDQLNAHPWIKSAHVVRHWPESIELLIEERRPVAMWNDLYLIEADGEIFEPDLMPNVNWINLVGPEAHRMKMLDGMQKITQAMRTIGVKVDKIILDYRGAWTIILENNVELYLGSSLFEERLRKFILHYPSSIRAKMDSIMAIDFRYDHGYALKWKQ